MATAETLALGANILLTWMQQMQTFQAKVVAGTITDADLDEAAAKVGVSRQALVDAIAAAKAQP